MQEFDSMTVEAIAEIVSLQYEGRFFSDTGEIVSFFNRAKVELPQQVLGPLPAGVPDVATRVLYYLNGTANFELVLLRLTSPVEYGANQGRHRNVLEQINRILWNEGLKIELDDSSRNPRIVDYQEVEQSQSQLEEMNNPPERAMGDEVFIVHGSDAGRRDTLVRFLKEELNLSTIVLQEQPDAGRTVIEKFEHYAEQAGFAVALLTPDDDVGSPAATTSGNQSRARQNVIFELGYFIGKLGRSRVRALIAGNVEMLSDYEGILYTEMDERGAWKQGLQRELKNAGFDGVI